MLLHIIVINSNICVHNNKLTFYYGHENIYFLKVLKIRGKPMKYMKRILLAVSLIVGIGASAGCGNDNIMDELAQDGRFLNLVQNLVATNLDVTLRNDGPYTLFAPTDAAFEGLELPDDVEKLAFVLQNHVVAGEFNADDLRNLIANNENVLTALSGETITITEDADGNLYANDALIVDADIEAENGVIHAINALLI